MNTNHPIDALGKLKAQIAELEAQEKILRGEVIALGAGRHEGQLYCVTVTLSERNTLDMEAVRKKLSPQFIAAHTRTTEVTTVKVTAR